MAKLRHIAFISLEPKNLSGFYQNYFALEEVKIFPSGSRMVIDGLFNLAFLQRRALPKCASSQSRGAIFRHPGERSRIGQAESRIRRRRSSTVFQGQIQLIDPEGNRVIVSERGWAN